MGLEPSVFMSQVRSRRPLVHHITNYVTVNDCANMCLCAGGSPVMTDDIDDVADMVAVSDALVLNMGTLSRRTVGSMHAAGRVAKSVGVPVVFDPVGAGATPFRRMVAESLIADVRPEVIKGNHGEMGILSGIGGGVRGVDSEGASGDVSEVVRTIARRWGCVAVSTGEVDYVSDGESVAVLSNGHPFESAVTGTGCMLSSVVGAYVGACGMSLGSVASAVTVFNVAAEEAAAVSGGPGTFRQVFLDSVYNIDGPTVDRMARCSL